MYRAPGLIAIILPLLMTVNGDSTSQWALDFLHAQDVWQLSTGVGVTLAVVDSGVSPSAGLGDRLLIGADFSQGTSVSTGNGRTDTDWDGHGTGMASLIGGSRSTEAAETVGLAPDCLILPVRASTTNGSGVTFGLAPALRYASTHGAKVINLSVVEPADEQETRNAIRRAIAQDAVVVAGVGNDGNGTQYYPAAYPGVLGVGAIDRYGKVWSQSNTGADVGLVAPGVDIYRDDNQGRQGYSDGTSEATAYVSAAAALVRSAHPTWTAPQVVAALIATADKPAAMHGAVRTDEYGYGILDVLAALRLSEPPPVGGTASPDPVKSAPDTKAASQSPSGDGSGLAIALVGGVLAGLAALVGTVLVRRRAGARRQG
jgi:type VII secretion-associated serine protease mycosin